MNTSTDEISVASKKKKDKHKKKKKQGRFNLIDFLLVLIILLVIATVIYVFAPFSAMKNLLSAQTVNIEYTVEIIGVDKDLINKIQENDIVVDAVSKGQIGTVQVADYNYPHTVLQYVQNEDQPEGILVEHPDKCNVLVTISASAEYLEAQGYEVNHCRIAVGEKIQMIFPNYICEGYCIDLSVES